MYDQPRACRCLVYLTAFIISNLLDSIVRIFEMFLRLFAKYSLSGLRNVRSSNGTKLTSLFNQKNLSR